MAYEWGAEDVALLGLALLLYELCTECNCAMCKMVHVVFPQGNHLDAGISFTSQNPCSGCYVVLLVYLFTHPVPHYICLV